MSFGESHGSAVGGVIDGCPAGIALSADFIQGELNRRRPGQSEVSTPRKEEDTVEILSGIFEGKSTGMPIGFLVRNQNQNSKDYNHLKDLYRPSHADYTWEKKYGIRDYRGGTHCPSRCRGCCQTGVGRLRDKHSGIYFTSRTDCCYPALSGVALGAGRR